MLRGVLLRLACTEVPSLVPGPPIAPETGILRIHTRPTSQIWLDGRLVGMTPQMRIELPEGTHSVRLVVPERGLERTITVEIRAGQTTTRIVTIEPGPG